MSQSSTILITGGTGLVGSRLTQLLINKGYQIIILSRHPKPGSGTNPSFAKWDVDKGYIDESALANADYIIHLAGAGIADKRWTEKRKQEIVDSRVKGSALIAAALKTKPNHVKAVISASAIGWYGSDPAPGPNGYTETDQPDSGFLGKTCSAWEAAIDPVAETGRRLVKLRIGIVLSENGGAFVEFKKPIRMGIAAILGSGQQLVSWIHLEDLCRMFIYCLEEEKIRGAFNAVAPNPVTNKELTLEIAKQLKGKFYIPFHVPAFILKIMVGEMSIEVLKSTTASAAKIHETGFHFLYPDIEPAVEVLLSKKVIAE